MELIDPDNGAGLTDKINAEPAAFKGCSSSELAGIMLGALAFWPPIALTVSWRLGHFLAGIGGVGLLCVATVFVGASKLGKLKRNRPDSYYVHWAMKFLHEWDLHRTPVIWRSGIWDVGGNGE